MNHQRTSDQPVGVFLVEWLGRFAPVWSENTESIYRLTIEKHIVPLIGDVPIGELDELRIRQMLATLLKNEVGDRTRKNAYQVLRTAMRQAIEDGILATNPCQNVKSPRSRRYAIRPFSLEEASRLMTETAGTRLHAYLVLSITVGARQGELLGLQRKDIDLAAGTMRIERQLTQVRGKMYTRKPKTEAGVRVVHLPEVAVEALREHYRILLRDGLAGSQLLFPAAGGGPQYANNFRRRQWNPLLKRLGLDHRGVHHLRHTFATLALGAGTPGHIVAQIVGHSRASTTTDIYGHVLTDQKLKAAETVNSLFKKQG